MAELKSVVRDKNLLKFEIESGKYGTHASYCFKTNEMIVDNKKVGSLQRYFSVINKSEYYYDSSSIDKVLAKCDDEGTNNFFRYVQNKNKNCTSFNTLLTRFKDYSRQEQWLSIIPLDFCRWYDRYKFPNGVPSDYPKPLRKRMSTDKSIYNMIIDMDGVEHFQLFERLYELNKIHHFNDELFGRFDLEYTYRMNKSYVFGKIYDLIKDFNCEPMALMDKLQYYQRYEGLEWQKSVDELYDYIRMNKLLGKTNFTKYPRMLRSCHDIITNVYKLNKEEYEEKEFAMIAKPELEWVDKSKVIKVEDGDDITETYTVIIPTSPKHIQEEGVNQSHCVASYVKSVIKGQTYICFLRIQEDINTPVLTLEVKHNKLVTALGYHNRSPTTSEKVVLQKWCDKVKIGYGI